MNNLPLVKRVTLDVLLACLVCTVSVGVFSFFIHRSQVIQTNADRALDIARAVCAALDADEYAAIMASGEENDYYRQYKTFLNEIYERSGAVYIYILDADYGSQTVYFAEGWPDGGREDEEEFRLGNTEDADVYPEEMFTALETGGDMVTGIYDLGGFGDMISGFSVKSDSAGRAMFVVGVDLPLSSVMADVKSFGLFIVLIAVVTFVAVAIVVSHQSKKTFVHLTNMANAITEIGTRGNLTLPTGLVSKAGTTAKWKNEIGMCGRAIGTLRAHLKYLEQILTNIAAGDLSVDITPLSGEDAIGNAIKDTADSLSKMLSVVRTSTLQVTTGTKQIADGSQVLADGASEQADSIERLSLAITEITSNINENAALAARASSLAESIKESAETGNRQMDEMMAAVNDIQEAGQNINKIIKVIDDIAFQTNILALNAAVEAARAGQHGKGFAVVAEEVRSLAAKSAAAAKDTGGLIADSTQKAELGHRIAGETAASLAQIVAGIHESSEIVAEIASAYESQRAGIAEISIGIDKVSQVVQEISATAEQSAAASEQMSGQAVSLEDLVSQFKTKENLWQSSLPEGR